MPGDIEYWLRHAYSPWIAWKRSCGEGDASGGVAGAANGFGIIIGRFFACRSIGMKLYLFIRISAYNEHSYCRRVSDYDYHR